MWAETIDRFFIPQLPYLVSIHLLFMATFTLKSAKIVIENIFRQLFHQ
ncbi:hypothetical protein HMPREF0693_1798 [Proteus mirabilis ATCC 29906]|nr:hypothetical protein CSC16_0302 [Proteus mirabilis]EEI48203.1 hypothetical protein HMPREF0693_1798 [Proteus mirabilis ATCC 29906]KXB99276.1 hypothetical protein HMPREF3203_03307 [Proteus mirabilis]PVF71727.1 hypothetical protein CSC14_1062 [Proteus mirabilis]